MLSFPYHLLAEWSCFIASILLLRNLDSKFWVVVKLYLFSVVLIESVGRYLIVRNNQWMYNLYTPVEFTFGIWIISKIIDSRNVKYIFLFSYVIFLGYYIIELVKYKGIDTFFNDSSTIGSVIIIGLCILYYYMLFEQDRYVNLLADPAFWFISGYFIFYTTSVGIETFFKKLEGIMVSPTVSLGSVIMDILNLILYGFWIVAFICLKNKRKSLQTS